MPELPEVEQVVRTLRPHVEHRVIERVQLHRSDIITPSGFDLRGHILGQRIVSLTRRAKRIVFTLASGNRFYIHLGMTGRLTREATAATLRPHTHLVLHVAGNESHEIRLVDPRRFGGVFWLGAGAIDDAIGPEPLDVPLDELAARLRRTSRSIKTTLLDQAVLAGLGNIYVDEALHRSRIHPLRRADKLKRDEVAQLDAAIKKVLDEAIHAGGSTLRDYVDADGNAGAFQKLHRVYGREGEACDGCGTLITRIVIATRSTHFCKICQPRRKSTVA